MHDNLITCRSKRRVKPKEKLYKSNLNAHRRGTTSKPTVQLPGLRGHNQPNGRSAELHGKVSHTRTRAPEAPCSDSLKNLKRAVKTNTGEANTRIKGICEWRYPISLTNANV